MAEELCGFLVESHSKKLIKGVEYFFSVYIMHI